MMKFMKSAGKEILFYKMDFCRHYLGRVFAKDNKGKEAARRLLAEYHIDDKAILERVEFRNIEQGETESW
mgnify:CR=1 FL=1